MIIFANQSILIRKILKGIRALQPAEIFLSCAVFFGVGFLIITPPMQSPDEVEHFYRSYQISQGDFVPSGVIAPGHGGISEGYGGSIPRSVVESAELLKGKVAGSALKFDYSVIDKAANIPLNRTDRQLIRFDNTSIYSPVPYTPQAIGIGVGKLFNASPLVLSYFARLFNLVFWVAIIYLAIKLTPIGKWVFVALALNPVSVFLSANMSSDVLTTALVALFVAAILRMRMYDTKPQIKWLVLIVLLGVSVGLLKNAYIPTVLLLFAIPSSVFAMKWKALSVILAVSVGLAWNLTILSAAQEIPEYFGIYAHINAKDQILNILATPLHFAGILGWNVFGTPSILLPKNMYGVIGWGDTPLPYWLSLLSMLGVVLSFLYRDATKRIVNKVQPRHVRMIFISVFGLSVALLIASLYAGWTQVGARLIQGLQGRYYIPLSFLLVPVFAHGPMRVAGTNHIFEKTIISIVVITLTASLIISALRYSIGIWW